MAAVLLVAVLMACAKSSPNHDDLQAESPIHVAWQQYGVPADSTMSSAAQNDTSIGPNSCQFVHTQAFKPINIGFALVDVDGVTVSASVKDHVSNVLMPQAIEYLRQTVSVRPADSLHANHVHTSCWSSSTTTSTTSTTTTNSTNSTSTTSTPGVNSSMTSPMYTCESEALTCGSDKLQIPDAYMTAWRRCSNCSTSTVLIHDKDDLRNCEACARGDDGVDAHGYDFFALVTIRDTPGCIDTIKAYSSSCVRDQCDRPIFGALNLCASRLSLDAAESWRFVSLIIHEFTHMLVFSSTLFRYFRNVDGSPKLPRDVSDESKVLGEVPWSCQSASTWTYPDGAGQRVHVDLVGQGVVGEYSERGINTCGCPIGDGINNTMSSSCLVPMNGLRSPTCVLKLRTPKVVEMARLHFDCPSLQGAELENQGAKCTIFNSHWEQRIFMGELMTSTVTTSDVSISMVTLALFEDSGWYLPRYHMADYHIMGVSWGYKQGCSFANGRCLTNGATSYPRHWCSSSSARACSMDRKSESMCAVDAFPSVPSIISYFAGDIYTGTVPELDYCPFHQLTVNAHICTSTSSLSVPDGTVNFMRELFGASSRCLESTLRGNVQASGGGEYVANPVDFASARPVCLEVACSADGASYAVKLANLDAVPASTLVLGICYTAGQSLTSPSLQGQVTCADPGEICPSPLLDFTKHYLRWKTTTTTSTSNSSSTTTTSTTDPNATTTTDPNATTTSSTSHTTSTSTFSSSTATNTTMTTNTSSTIDPNSTTTSTTATTTTSTTSTTTLLPPPLPPTTTSTSTTSTTTTTSTTVPSTTTTTTSTNTTTVPSTTTTPVILWLEGSLTIIVYDLASLPEFIHDMTEFKIFEQNIADTVFGVKASMIKIMDIVPAPTTTTTLTTTTSTTTPRKRWRRRLQDTYYDVKPPTPLEASGVKPDGKAGGPKEDVVKVLFRIMIGNDKDLAWRVLRELPGVDFQAMTFQLTVLMSKKLPRSYTVAIVGVDVEPALTLDGSDNAATAPPPATAGSRRLLFSIAWPFVVIFGATAANVVRWL